MPTWFSRLSRIRPLHGFFGSVTKYNTNKVWRKFRNETVLSLNQIKTVARSKASELRFHIHRQIGCEASQKISTHIEKFLVARKDFKVIAAYMPIKTEIDITSVVPKIRELGKILCLPVIISNNEPLAFKVWNENSQLIEGKLRVVVPVTDEILEPDVVLCPMLSFDVNGYRLGYGGGFYDRTIESLKKKKRVFTLGCAYSQQLVSNKLPVGKYDKPVDAIVTENGLTYFGR